MTLNELAAVLETGDALLPPWREREVSAVVQDSRKTVPGCLFVAVRGFHSDGHQFVSQAIRQGAAAVVVEDAAAVEAPETAAVIRVPDTRKALASLAAKFYGYPSRRLKLVGITGTKGKTTTSYLTRSVIESAGYAPAGLIGTIEYRIGDRAYPALNTTPESLELQALLAEMAEQHASHCVMEVSSHALSLGRTDGCVFEAAAFTNLAQDHLDFHETMEDYFQAKLLLFTGLAPDKTAVVNIDDDRGGTVAAATRARVITFGLSEKAAVRPAGPVRQGIRGISFTARTPGGDVVVDSPLVGRHNVYNILAAAALGSALGIPAERIADGIRRMRAVPGRMEPVEAGQDFGVVVDYAHTEGSLLSLLETVRGVADRRVITVFGCGGDRDRTKRPRMGRAALAASDAVIVTSDNPRTEDPLAIISEIETGMSGGRRVTRREDLLAQAAGGPTPYLVIPDRAAAIDAAVGIAQPGDVVVLAGKGHEDYQLVGERKTPFDDREEARKAIKKHRMEP